MSDERDQADQELAKNQQDPEHPLSEETPTEAREELHIDPNSGLAPQPGGWAGVDAYLEGHGHAPDGVSLNDDGSAIVDDGDQGEDQGEDAPEYSTEEAVRAKELETQAISPENAKVESNVPDEQGDGGEPDEHTVAESVAAHAGAEQGPVTPRDAPNLEDAVNPMDVEADRDTTDDSDQGEAEVEDDDSDDSSSSGSQSTAKKTAAKKTAKKSGGK